LSEADLRRDLCSVLNQFTNSSLMIFSLVAPATKNPIKKQVRVTVRIEMSGQKKTDSLRVKKKEATESPSRPRMRMSPRIAPTTLPFGPLFAYPIPYMIQATALRKPAPAAIRGKVAPAMRIVTMKVGSCSKKFACTL